MSGRKRAREKRGGGEAVAPTRGHSPLPSSSSSYDAEEGANFGSFLWNDVSIMLFYRLQYALHTALLSLAMSPPAMWSGNVAALEEDMNLIWAVAEKHLTEEEWQQCEEKLNSFSTSFLTGLRQCVAEASKEGALVLLLSRGLLKLLEDHGFPEREGGSLTRYTAELTQEADLNGYSYNSRATLTIPLLPRYDGDKRSEEEHSRRRVGYVVELPSPHPHPEINTEIQLIEPKRRKSTLDESRVFSHPKRSAAFATDDFGLDDELLHRAYVVLATHLDAYGSLHRLSPYARLLLWNLLGRDEKLFDALLNQRISTEAARQQLVRLRELLCLHQKSFDATRCLVRQASAVVGWYALSAQWRDQAIYQLADLEETDWYFLADAFRSGGKAIFPNYSHSGAVVHLAMGVLKKLDRIHAKERDGAPPVHDTVKELLLPWLKGEAPELQPHGVVSSAIVPSTAHYQRRLRRLKSLFDDAGKGNGVASPSSPACASSASHVNAYLCSTLIFPLQCVGELLELCALAAFSPAGMDGFTRSFLATNWENEEGILGYLMKREPSNVTIVPLVGLPRLYKDLVTSIQLLVQDRMVPYVVRARLLADTSRAVSLHQTSYVYWKALATMVLEEDRFDDLLHLSVDIRENDTCYYTEATMERVPKVWPQDLKEFVEEEAALRAAP